MPKGKYPRYKPSWNYGKTKFDDERIKQLGKSQSITRQKQKEMYEKYVKELGEEKAQKLMIELCGRYFGKGSLEKRLGKAQADLLEKSLSLQRKNTLLDELYQIQPNSSGSREVKELWLLKKYMTMLRDDFICQICKKKNSRLVHHIINKRLLIDGDYPWNLITLCRNCHTRIENILSMMFYGQSRRKIDNFIEYLKHKFKIPYEKAVWVKELFFDTVEQYLNELDIPLETIRETSENQSDDIVRTTDIDETVELPRNTVASL